MQILSRNVIAVSAMAMACFSLSVPAWAQNAPPIAVDDDFQISGSTAIGSRQILSAAANVGLPDTTALTSVTALTAWDEAGDILGQTAIGNSVGTVFTLNSTTTGTQSSVRLATMSNGNVVATWTDGSGVDDADSTGIRARIFDAFQQPLGPDFPVNSTTVSAQSWPAIAALTGGGFVIVWEDASATGSDTAGSAIRGQRFDASGAAQGSEFVINDTTAGDQLRPDVTGLANGGFAASWAEGAAFRARLFSSVALPASASFRINDGHDLENTTFPPRLAGLNGGGLAAAWDAGFIHARRFDPSGAPQGAAFRVDGANDDQGIADISPLANGGFAVAWASNNIVQVFPGTRPQFNNQLRANFYDAGGNYLTFWNSGATFGNKTSTAIAPQPGGGIFAVTRLGASAFANPESHAFTVSLIDSPFVVGINAINPLANDSDPEGQPLSFTAFNGQPVPGVFDTVTLPSGARVSRNLTADVGIFHDSVGVPSFVALPVGQTVVDTFTYTITDGVSTGMATVNLTISGANDRPTAVDDAISFGEDDAGRNVAPEVLANDIEPDTGEQGLLSIWSLGRTSNGGQLSGTLPDVTYTPAGTANRLAQGETLIDTFAYLLRDPYAVTSSQGTVTVTINGANDLPSLAAISASTDEATPLDLTAAVLAQVSDPDTNDIHTVTAFDAPDIRGQLMLNAGILTYDPDGAFDVLGAGESADETFGVTISDPHGGTASAMVTVGVNGTGAVNQPPDAVDDAITGTLAQPFPSTALPATMVTGSGFDVIPDLAGLTGNGFVAVWEDNAVIRALRFDANNQPVGSDFAVNTLTASSGSAPRVAPLPNNGFVVVWRDTSALAPDNSGTAIRARLFDGNGQPQGTEFLVNTTHLNSQSQPDIASLTHGGFVVTWTDDSRLSADTSEAAVRAQQFNASGTPVGGEILVNSAFDFTQHQPRVTGLPAGRFAIVWRDLRPGSGTINASIWVRQFAADGTPVTNDALVDSSAVGNVSEPRIATLPTGGYVVVWQASTNTEGPVFARLFDADGSPSGNAFQAVANSRTPPTLAGLSDGFGVGTFDVFLITNRFGTLFGKDSRLTRFSSTGQVLATGYSSSCLCGVETPIATRLNDGGTVFIYFDGNFLNGFARRPAIVPITVNTIARLDVLANDTDPEGQNLTITAVNSRPLTAGQTLALADGARVTLSSSRLDYNASLAPAAIALPQGISGILSFDYTITDGFLTDSATTQVTVVGLNDPPVANDDAFTIAANAAPVDVSLIALANDSDPDTGEAARLRISSIIQPQRGQLLVNPYRFDPAGQFDFLPAGQSTTETILYGVADPRGAVSLTATITVTITGVNDAPTVADITASTGKRSSINIASLIRQAASDPDTGDSLTIASVGTAGTAGMVRLENGDVVYDPAGAFPGLGSGETAQDTFTYTVRDAQGAEASGTATITINGGPNTLAVSLDGLGSGQVGSTPGGVACGNGLFACTVSFDAGSTVTLNASALAGSRFAGWVTGPCAGQTGTCDITMERDRSATARFETETTTPTPVYLATLPNARGGSVGGPDITAFATAVSGGEAVQGCTIALPGGAPVGFAYQRLDAGNIPVGPLNPEFDIPQNGAVGFVLAMTPNQATGPDGYLMQPQLMCENATADPIEGANSVLLSVSAVPGPDILSVSATASGDGIIRIPAIGRTGLMVAAAVNIGAGPAPVTARVDTGAAQLPVTLQVCETDAAGTCLAPRASEVATNIGGAPAFFAVFVRGDGAVALDPANARAFLRFVDAGGVTQSATSAAITVPAPAGAAPVMEGRYSVLVRQADGVWPSLVRASLYVSDGGWAILDDGVMPRQLTVAGNLDDGVAIAGMGARFRSDGFVRAGHPDMDQAGSFWGVRDVRGDVAPDWTQLAGVYAGTIQLTASGRLQGSLADCQLAGAPLPFSNAAGLRLMDIQLTGCDTAGSYRGVLDTAADHSSVLIIAGETRGWSAARQ
jgi:VCBS repeat-containing protein